MNRFLLYQINVSWLYYDGYGVMEMRLLALEYGKDTTACIPKRGMHGIQKLFHLFVLRGYYICMMYMVMLFFKLNL